MNTREENTQITANLSDAAKSKKYWRSLEELAETNEFQDFLHREFPRQASEWLDSFSRRNFLKVMGASLALAGFTACGVQAPVEKIVPYVQAPEEIVPGKPLFYATAMSLAGQVIGLLVENHMGRPTKVEGNPEHPASLGATGIYAQAAILGLYDPDRSKSVTYLGEQKSWPAFLGAVSEFLPALQQNQGAGIAILTESVLSPSFAAQLQAITAAYPQAKLYQYEPAGNDNLRAGAKLAFGEYVNTVYDFQQAEVVLALDADFLAAGTANIRYAREFMRRRRVEDTEDKMNRLYVLENTVSGTGAVADHRVGVRPSEMEALVRAIAAALGVTGVGSGSNGKVPAEWVNALVADLKANAGKSIVIVGESQPPIIHALAHAINQQLENVGKTVVYTAAIEYNPTDQVESLQTLVKDIDDNKVALLLIVEGNPVYNAPVDLKFAERLQKVKFSAHLSLYNDETSQYCQWHVPAAHFLEAWTDLRTYDGTITIAQPLIYPLYDGKSAHEFITALTDKPDMTGYDLVRGYWQGQQLGGETFETVWRKALHDGTVANTKLEAKAVTVKTEALAEKGANSSSGLEITFRPDPTVFDGRFANNGWLQELPKPLTKLTWDNAVLINPKTATKLNIDGHRFGRHGGERGEAYADIVEVRFQGRSVTAPVWVTPGQPEDVITLHLGYGREYAGQVANKIGFNAYSVRSTTAMWAGNGVEIVKRDGSYGLACTQGHHLMEGRDIVRSGTLAEFLKNRSLAPEHGGGHGGETAAHASPDAGHGAGAANNREADHATDHNGEHKKRSLSMYPGFKYEGYAWGMTIDVNSCVGCNACVVACQAENNGPVVGKEQVMMARSMHWIRIDSYYRTVDEQSPTENPETYFQPVPCMQCENAPCEVVCPVGATVHSAEGLNDMVYNRCIGTRYCSNNCPYKVRRFNFLDYSDFRTPSLKLSRNPDVTVRSRGVMEKCTYCVQRINQARLEAEKENRPIRDGEIVTACQAVCPTEAIVFGDTNNAESLVAKLKKRERNYGLLDEEINTKPRTTYLGALRNPNPEMKKG